MSHIKNYIQQSRFALFDWSVVVISFSLGFVFPTISDFIRSPGFYNWMLAALFLYITGAFLKQLPLSYRMDLSGRPLRQIPYTIFLVIGHWIIIFLAVIFSEPAFRKLVDLPPIPKENTSDWHWVAAAIAAFVTWLVYRSKTKWKRKKVYPVNTLFWMELIADIFLTSGVAIFSFVFWEKGAMALLSRSPTNTIGDIWFLFIFLAILFLFFYLPLRYLYFIEDSQGGANRRRLLYIFGFMLLRALLDMLSI